MATPGAPKPTEETPQTETTPIPETPTAETRPNFLTTQPPPEPDETPVVPPAEKGDTRQATREWLESMGITVGTVASRGAARVEAEAPTERRPQELSDTDRLRSLLHEGDDEAFIEGVIDAASRRTLGGIAHQERQAKLGDKINEFVSKFAPDVPLVMFWAYGEAAEMRFPQELDKQIDWAIGMARGAMEAHTTRQRELEGRERETREASDTLDGTPTRQRRRGATTSEPRVESLVEQLNKHRSKYE